MQSALAGSREGLSIAERARLERLLLAFWRSRLDLGELSPIASLRAMRAHAVAGRLLRELEAWLHARPGAQRIDVAALLAPYRTAPAIALEEGSAP